MVKVEHHKDVTHLYLVPNRSAIWRQTRSAIAAVATVTLAVALFWSSQGFWMILPFAGLEVGLFAWLTYRVCGATYHQQVVLCSPKDLEAQWGSTYPKKHWVFDHATAELEVVRPHSLSPCRLHLKDARQTLPVADQLNKDDAQLALEQFRSLGFFPTYSGRTTVIPLEAFEH